MSNSVRRGLYAITDPAVITAPDGLALLESVLAAGAVMVQWRDKPGAAMKGVSKDESIELARRAHALCQRHDAALIINDNVALAQQIGADGVHLGREDMPLSEARALLGKQAIIGASCYADIDRARNACAAGADYVAFGSIFDSPTKPGAARAPLSLISDACTLMTCPVAAIGGIDATNAREVIAAGADLVAVISGLWDADEPAAAAAAINQLFRKR